jgi:hypothetical protein
VLRWPTIVLLTNNASLFAYCAVNGDESGRILARDQLVVLMLLWLAQLNCHG